MHEKNWIPASIPPAQDGMYLTTIKVYGEGDDCFKYLHIAELYQGIWRDANDDVTILAWQPLPALYKAGD